MWPLMPSFAICLAAVVLPAGLTLLSQVVLSWSPAVRRVKLGALPGGTVVPVLLVPGLGPLGRLSTFGAA